MCAAAPFFFGFSCSKTMGSSSPGMGPSLPPVVTDLAAGGLGAGAALAFGAAGVDSDLELALADGVASALGSAFAFALAFPLAFGAGAGSSFAFFAAGGPDASSAAAGADGATGAAGAAGEAGVGCLRFPDTVVGASSATAGVPVAGAVAGVAVSTESPCLPASVSDGLLPAPSAYCMSTGIARKRTIPPFGVHPSWLGVRDVSMTLSSMSSKPTADADTP
mmetsp:Transcript_13367/g.36756  ORF Transcript_13367/g.36756 Transcript_13367/m.36756 type:complete len:221 (-) Transcript_13367:243-905(-)